MHRFRSAALALLAVGVALAVACQGKSSNGQDCLKDSDCESNSCIAYICVDPNASRPPFDGGTTTAETSTTDSGAADGDAAPAETSAMDTGTETDTAMASDTGAAD
ncbi:MAG: hypothetical protein ACXWP4_00550 [Polyangiales bacterium]